ncbi:hypothetical protein DFJ73DRAFT_823537 [Zopfochytrium polystomum]|nr:hypothetical protein DFJ73DRAFT_823537 [Zopfochytrium polystomum]
MSDMDVDDKAPLKLEVLEMITDSRNQHGLRHQDYQRYRQYCTRKIKRVRSVVGLTQGEKKKKFLKKPITSESVKSSRHLEIVLYEAERAWSYAMQLKAESAASPRKRFHLVKRLQRASQNANSLAALCQELETDDRTNLEVQAYSLLMGGYLNVECQKWQVALDKFGASRTIYEKLLSASSAHQEALCQSFIDAIDPNIRYCAYNLRLVGGSEPNQDISALLEMRRRAQGAGAGLDLLAAQVDEVLARSRHDRVAGSSATATIEWRGKVVPCKNQRFMEALMAAQEAAASLESEITKDGPILDETSGKVRSEIVDKRVESYAKVVGSFWDATKIAEADVKEDEIATNRVKSSKSEENTANLKFIHSYVSFVRLNKTIERNQFLAEATTIRLTTATAISDKKQPKPFDLVRVDDIILQTLKEMSELPAVKDDPFLQSTLSVKMAAFKGKRAAHIAQMLVSHQNFKEALALYNRAKEHTTQARAELTRIQSKTKSGAGKKTAAPGSYLSEADKLEMDALDREVRSADESFRAGFAETHALWVLRGAAGVAGSVSSLGKEVESLALKEDPHAGALATEPSPSAKMDAFLTNFDLSRPPAFVDFPVRPNAVPLKPYFFDVAFNELTYPEENIRRRSAGLSRLASSTAIEADLSGQKGSPANPPGSPAASSIGGFLSGLWSRK